MTVGDESPPPEPVNDGSVGRFSLPNLKKPNRSEIIRWNFVDLARSHPFPARSQLDPWNLHQIWRDLTGSREISSNLVRFHQIWWIFGDIPAKISLKFRRTDYQFSNHWYFGQFSNLSLWPNRPPSVEGRINPIQSTTLVGGRLKFRIPDLVKSVSSWAQTQHGLTRG